MLRSQNSSRSQIINHAFIIGWYGTETAGDKAILGEIIYQLKLQGVECITLASFTPFLSEWTLKELNYSNVKIIPTYSNKFLQTAATADVTIMGGGPLMDLRALAAMLSAFAQAKKHKKKTRIAGCGIGPLQDIRYVEIVKRMLRLADIIELRDAPSVKWGEEQTGRTDIKHTGDFAVGFVRRWQQEQSQQPTKTPYLNCYLREWTPEYKGELTLSEFLELKDNFEEQLAAWIVSLCHDLSLQPRFLAMHHFVGGNDDRVFNRRFAQQYLTQLEPRLESRPYSAQGILQSMEEASFCLTMRFHSTLFAHTLGVPFYAIDYTRGGKIHGFLSDNNGLDKLISLDGVVEGKWQNMNSKHRV